MPDDDRTGRIEPTLRAPEGERRPSRIPSAEEEILSKLDSFIDGLAADFAGLTRDLRDSGFGPYALGNAKALFDQFVTAVDATRRGSSAVHPWEELRSLAERLAVLGEEVAAAEILEGLAKRSARHALPAAFKARLEADRKASQKRAAEREATTAPILMPELKAGPRVAEFAAGPRSVLESERSVGGGRLALAAAGFVAAIVLAIGGNYALMNLAPATAPSTDNREAVQVAATATPEKKPLPAAVDQDRSGREAAQSTKTVADSARKTEEARPAPVNTDSAASTPSPEATQRSAATTTASSGTTTTSATPTTQADRPAAAATAPATTADAARTTSAGDALEMNAAGRVQKRLVELGYLTGAVDGVWGPRSRVALSNFKLTNGLPQDDTLDARTRTLLFSVSARAFGQRAPIEANTNTNTNGNTNVASNSAGAFNTGAVNTGASNSGAIAAPGPGGSGMAAGGDYQGPPVVSTEAATDQPNEADWDPASQQAFNDFNALTNADRYVVGSERLRGGEGSILGTWGRGAANCMVGEEPSRDMLWISRQTVSGAGRSCEVVEVRRSGSNWLVVGRCANGLSAYRFAVQGDRMVEFASGGTIYRRCEVRRPGFSAAYYDPPTPPQEIGGRDYFGPRDYVGPRDYQGRDMTPPRDVGGGVSISGGAIGGAPIGGGVSAGGNAIGGVSVGGNSVIILPRR